MVAADSPAVVVSMGIHAGHLLLYLIVHVQHLKCIVRNVIFQILVKGKGEAQAHCVHKSSALKKHVRGAANKSCRTVAFLLLLPHSMPFCKHV